MANRDFKIELDNVEMINGSDDLLKDTKVTQVTLTGENKLNSLNSTFENCTELTAIEGDVNLDGVSDMTEMALNTSLDELKVINPTEENIQADNSLNQVANVKIGGTKYSKGGVQDVVGSLEWNAENFTYEDTILDNVYTNSSSIEDNKNITVSDTLEQKATSIEITGQTYENLVNGKATKNLLDEMSMQQTEGKPTQFTPHMEQPICLEYIEGQTYKNLIEGKGEYKLTDTFSTTWTESNNSIENPPSVIEITEMWGNTVQDETDLSNIQSVGDLYVDEDGEAILDEEGNKQYKLEIISSDGNGKSNKTTILMPQPLRKVGDFCDKLYYDYERNKYILEVNIDPYSEVLIGSFLNQTQTDNYITMYQHINNYPKIKPTTVLCNTLPSIKNFNATEVGVYGANAVIYFTLRKSELTSYDGLGFEEWFTNNPSYLVGVLINPQIVETKILEKPSLETYSPKTYISTNAEIQPSQMAVTNKKVDFIPLGLQPNKDYTLQLDSIGKNDKPITVNLGGTETTIQPINDTSKHHKVVVRTPSTLTTDKLELTGEGVVVNDVMLFQTYELQEDGTYKIDILTTNGQGKNCLTYKLLENSTTSGSQGYTIFDLGIEIHGSFTITVKNNTGYPIRVKIAGTPNDISFENNQGSYSGTLNGNLAIAVISTDENLWIMNGGGKDNFLNAIKNGGLGIVIDSDDRSLNYHYEKEVTQSILLPQPLNKIGDIKDKFYWDDDKGHYCIEQNVEDYIITKDSPFIYRGYKSSNVYAVLDKEVLGYDLTNKISLLGIKQYSQFPHQADELGYYINNETGEIEFVMHKLKVTNSLEGILSKLFEVQEEFNFMYGKTTPNIIDLPHLNKKYSLDTYMPTTYLECPNSPMEPYSLLLEDDTVRYKSTIEPSTLYTIQFNCLAKSTTNLTLDLGGSRKTVDPIIGVNHVQITTPSVLASDRLFLIGTGIVIKEVIVNKGEMNQYPKYFDDEQSVGELQEDGTYNITIHTDDYSSRWEEL